MKRKAWVLIIGMLMCLVGCTAAPKADQTVLSKHDLEGCELFVHNVTCSTLNEVRTVSDADYLKRIIELSTTVKYFRPVISVDIIFGAVPDAYFVFDNGKEIYTISFFDVEKQLDLEYEYRETPILTVAKETLDKTQTQDNWVGYCTMAASNYAELFEMIQTYTDGDISML